MAVALRARRLWLLGALALVACSGGPASRDASPVDVVPGVDGWSTPCLDGVPGIDVTFTCTGPCDYNNGDLHLVLPGSGDLDVRVFTAHHVVVAVPAGTAAGAASASFYGFVGAVDEWTGAATFTEDPTMCTYVTVPVTYTSHLPDAGPPDAR